jgi:cell division protein FtsL
MERFFGGNPGLVLLRLVILSLVVGVVLAALGFSPYDILQNLQDLAARIYDMGFAAVEKAFRYFLLGAVIVFPVWIVMRMFKVLGRDTDTQVPDTQVAETPAPNRET